MSWTDFLRGDRPEQESEERREPTEEEKARAAELLRQAYFGKDNDYQGGPRR